jgi:hypothetical protein
MDLAGIFISGVVGQEQMASKRCAKPVQGGLRDHSNPQVSLADYRPGQKQLYLPRIDSRFTALAYLPRTDSVL